MSYDLAIWKRSETAKTAMLAEAYKCICNGGCHWAMAPFDLVVQCSYSAAASIAPRVASIALGLGLLVYDPQRNVVFGNKRPSKKQAGGA